MREPRLLNGGNLIHVVIDYTTGDLGNHRPRKGTTVCGQTGDTWALDPWARGGVPKTPCPKCHKD